MTRPGLRRALTALLAVWTFLPMVIGSPTVQAASARQTAPPGINAAQPTVSGRLVAKATNGTTTGAAVCGRTTAAPTRMINRGLVICTSQGNLVLLQLSRSTGIFNRDWQRLAYARLALGDQLNAWGALGAGGALLNPTVAIQDLSKSSPRLQQVSGRLVAKPDGSSGGPVSCGGTMAAAPMINRGLVVCASSGKLVLFVLSAGTRLLAHDGTRVSVADLTLGDLLTGRGTLSAGGFALDPTVSVVNANVQRRGTNSQDLIAGSGSVLTLYVLKSDPGPVTGIVHAAPGEPSQITLCGGIRGTWRDLKQGLMIDVSQSLFNTRTMTYVDTNVISVASCR